MNISEFRIGNLINAGNALVEVVTIEDNGYTLGVKNLDGVVKEYDKLSVEPIFLERELVTSCFGFNEHGRLKITIGSRSFYFQEKDGHIILLENQLLPLIHFWDLKTVHQLQNFYYKFKGEELPFNITTWKFSSAINSGSR